ncbi:uncharacterized protein [Aquarana catesbeiana]|uniref:uncharacterized protein n=1 Tax=Aquarana catesbeiana TaxID=8400 RepID=UPI003CC9964F
MAGLERTVQTTHASIPNQQGELEQEPPRIWRKYKPKRKRGCRGRGKKEKRKLGEGIFNLTDVTFTQEELLVLDSGIKYAPKATFNQFEAFIDLQKFIRKLSLKKYFLEKEESQHQHTDTVYKHSKLRNKSTFNPRSTTNQHIEVFKRLVEKEIRNIKPTKSSKDRIWQGLRKLEKRKNIVIRPADKGGGVVILTKEDYYKELERLVKDPSTYQPLKKNPNRELKKKLKEYLDKGIADKILNKKEGRYLLTEAPRIPVIYQVPKIHKSKTKPPGRPIISGIESIHSRLGEYLDVFLQPIAGEGKSFLKDSKDVINNLKNLKVDNSTLLVTLDVESLYTNIKQTDALAAVAWGMKNLSDLQLKQRKFILEGLRMAMGYNFFWHNHKYYRQIKGVGMGNKYAPSVANIFLSKWEEEDIYGRCWPHLLLYKRYIDDILIIWKGSREQLEEFIQFISGNKYGVKFTATVHQQKINFLDLEIYKNGNKLGTRTHFKETDRNGYIPMGSCHHPQWKAAIPKSQFIRIRRNCDRMEDYLQQTDILIDRFTDKGYKRNVLENIRLKVANMDRELILSSKVRKHKQDNSIPFITGFNTQYKKLEDIIKKNWSIISSDPQLSKVLPRKPTFVYRKARRIRDKIVKNVPDPPKDFSTLFNQKGFFRCKKCKACRSTNQNDRKITSFMSNTKEQAYKIDKLITCCSTHVTYVLECSCGLQYVGRTTRALSVRIGEHVRNIKKGFKHHSVSKHFREVHDRNPQHLKFYGIDRIVRNWRNTNMKREVSKNETHWIFKLDTMRPQGLNVEIDINCFLEDY